jgi:HSP20 family molecular chaperone IbpA
LLCFGNTVPSAPKVTTTGGNGESYIYLLTDRSNNVLTISAEKTETKEEKTTKFHISERSFGKITRSVLIPKNVNNENIKAKYSDGILNIVLPKETKSN